MSLRADRPAIASSYVFLAAALLLLGSGSGCSEERRSVRASSPGAPAFVRNVALPANSFRLTGDSAPRGRFACGLAIARLEPAQAASGGDELIEVRELEQAFWQEAMLGVPAVRDLRFLTAIDMRRAEPTPQGLCKAAARNGADLLLIFSATKYSANAATIVGVLYDAQTGAALASVQSADDLPMADDEDDIDDARGDKRDVDASYQAARRFERSTRECLLALAERNQPPAATQPHNWNAGPVWFWTPTVPNYR
jgi:hypothetical protein